MHSPLSSLYKQIRKKSRKKVMNLRGVHKIALKGGVEA